MHSTENMEMIWSSFAAGLQFDMVNHMHMCVFKLCSLNCLPSAHFISLFYDYRLVISVVLLLPGEAQPWFAGCQIKHNNGFEKDNNLTKNNNQFGYQFIKKSPKVKMFYT